MIAGAYFVTPHAVHQFQQRIADLPYEAALAAIIHGCQSVPADQARPLTNGQGVYLRVTTGPHLFRAIILAGEPAPAIVTICRSGKSRPPRRRGRIDT